MAEILNPMCVATCSLDRSIVLFDIVHREHLRTIPNAHEKGIRHLKYNFATGGQMISIGSEIYVNVWAPESLVSDIHVGTLKGHKKGVTDGAFLGMAPYFATIDETYMINIFDIVSMINIQTIPGQSNS
jgi:WD40 repeat protein